MMTVKEFTSRVWYAQKIMIIKWQEFDKCNDIEDIRRRSLMVGDNCALRSSVYDNINNMLVDSYGSMGDVLVIEVH